MFTYNGGTASAGGFYIVLLLELVIFGAVAAILVGSTEFEHRLDALGRGGSK